MTEWKPIFPLSRFAGEGSGESKPVSPPEET
jgi:hypothetical protein